LLLIYCLILSLQSQAQAYEAGWVVRSNGDTLRGEIENNFWREPPTFIRFKPTPKSPSQLLQPRQLQAVRLNGGRYFRYEALPIDHAAETRAGHLPDGNHPDVRIDTLLAEVIVEGPATLLRVRRASTTHFLLRRSGQPILELTDRQYLKLDRNGERVLVNGNNYRAQLGLFFGDCPAASQVAHQQPYTTDGITAVVQAYNQQCSPAGQLGRSLLPLAEPRRRVSFQGGLLGGLRYNRVGSEAGPDGSCLTCHVHPYVGLYSELFMPGRNVALYSELTLSPYSYQDKLILANSTYVPVQGEAWLYTIHLGLRYYFALPHDRQWILGLGYESYNVFGRTEEVTGPSSTTLVRGTPQPSPVLFPQLSLGLRSRRWTMGLDGRMFTDSDSKLKVFGTDFVLRLGLAYRLGRNHDADAPKAVK